MNAQVSCESQLFYLHCQSFRVLFLDLEHPRSDPGVPCDGKATLLLNTDLLRQPASTAGWPDDLL